MGRQHPAHFGNAGYAGFHVALEISEADLAEELAALAILDNPIAIAEQGPEARCAEHAPPGIFRTQRFSADVAHDGGIAQHRALAVEIVLPVTSKPEP
jgi:hypothetical protein